MRCKNCNSEMILDDKDIHSKGNFDIYWICNECDIGCIEKIRVDKNSNTIWPEDRD